MVSQVVPLCKLRRVIPTQYVHGCDDDDDDPPPSPTNGMIPTSEEYTHSLQGSIMPYLQHHKPTRSLALYDEARFLGTQSFPFLYLLGLMLTD